jgi:broad specificity phosphatase PhoE
MRRFILSVLLCLASSAFAGPTVYYVRHGQGGHNISPRYVWDQVPQGQWLHWMGKIGNPNVFTPLGEEQVLSLTTNLAAFQFDLIAVSPLWRARHTILPYLKARGLTAEIWPELTESSFLGDPFAALSPEAESNLLAGVRELRVPADEQAYFHLRPDGTGRREFDVRTPAEAGALARRVDVLLRDRLGTNETRVLLVGHGHAGQTLIRLLGGDPAVRHEHLGNTHLWKMTLTPEGAFRFHYNNLTPAQAVARESAP